MEARRATDFDRRNLDWYIDKLVQVVVFIGGISAIVFIIGIFVFITKEGVGFIIDTMDFREFFTSPYWEPSDEDAPEYGILALIALTLLRVPLGAAMLTVAILGATSGKSSTPALNAPNRAPSSASKPWTMRPGRCWRNTTPWGASSTL